MRRSKHSIDEICPNQSNECQQSAVHCEGGSDHGGSTGSAIKAYFGCGVSNFIYNAAVYQSSRREPRQRRGSIIVTHLEVEVGKLL
jgi:hypothetical protein